MNFGVVTVSLLLTSAISTSLKSTLLLENYTFRTSWGIYCYKRMVMGTSPASSEIQKRVRDTIKDCKNAINIKDDILVHGKGKDHDTYLGEVLTALQEKGLTLRKEKCEFGKPQIKWFGNIYTKDGMSPDPGKCKIIKGWPQTKSCNEVKSFMQIVQFNAELLSRKVGQASYPDVTEPLRILTRKIVLLGTRAGMGIPRTEGQAL